MNKFIRTLGAALAVALPFLLARPASAQSTSEQIRSYVVDMSLAQNGSLQIREQIAYDFGALPKHGIFRDLPTRETWDAHHDRVYKIEDVNVTTPDGTPSQVQTSRTQHYLHLRIGDPNRTVTGVHTYDISYRVTGAPRAYPDHDELFWDPIGNQWSVPIANAQVRVQAPADISHTACFAGAQGSRLLCDQMSHSGVRATFSQHVLGPNEGLTIVVGMASGSIQPPPQPILQRRRTVLDAFAVRPDTVTPAAALAVLGVGGVLVLVYRKGRDRRYRGSAVDAAFGNVTGAEERVGLHRSMAGPVEFVPPDNVRPGQVGTLIDERANTLDVTATIVDLAVRGWLTIAEVDEHDYQLAATRTAGKGTLLPYETELMNGLFANGPTVKLSELKYKFRSELAVIEDSMYDDVVAQGWYHTRPDRTRHTWVALGLLVTAIGIGITVLVGLHSSYALIPVALVLCGVALLAAAGHMPARTPKGSALYSRVRGFRRLFDEGDEDVRARFAEQHDIFSQYLPYALVFGVTEKWARIFAGLGAEEVGAASWYVGSAPLNTLLLAGAIERFGTSATGTLYASAPSSSGGSGFGGGFAGGGGGGGGGGSW